MLLLLFTGGSVNTVGYITSTTALDDSVTATIAGPTITTTLSGDELP